MNSQYYYECMNLVSEILPTKLTYKYLAPN